MILFFCKFFSPFAALSDHFGGGGRGLRGYAPTTRTGTAIETQRCIGECMEESELTDRTVYMFCMVHDLIVFGEPDKALPDYEAMMAHL